MNKSLLPKDLMREPYHADKATLMREAYEEWLTEKEFISGEAITKWMDSWWTENELPPPEVDIFKS
jgi:hypothetical protein